MELLEGLDLDALGGGTFVQTPLGAERIERPFVVGGGIGHGSQVAADNSETCIGEVVSESATRGASVPSTGSRCSR